MTVPVELTSGVEASVILPPHRRPTRARLHRIEPDGTYTFIEPRCGGLRTVTVDHIVRVHKPKKAGP